MSAFKCNVDLERDGDKRGHYTAYECGVMISDHSLDFDDLATGLRPSDLDVGLDGAGRVICVQS